MSHGVAMLMLSGHLTTDTGCDPRATLVAGVRAMIVDAASGPR